MTVQPNPTRGVVYEYRIEGTVYCDGKRDFIQRFVSREELARLFGGWVDTLDLSGEFHYLGVRGRRESSRFRRILRERGAEFAIVRGHVDRGGRIEARR